MQGVASCGVGYTSAASDSRVVEALTRMSGIGLRRRKTTQGPLLNSPYGPITAPFDILRNSMKPPRDIHELWDQAIAAQTSEELDRVIPELRQALHNHCEDIREKLWQYPRIARRLSRQINDLLLDQEAQDDQAHQSRRTPELPRPKNEGK